MLNMKAGCCFTVVCFIIFGYPNSILGWRPYRIEISNVTAYSISETIEVNASLTENNGVSFYANLKQNLPQLFARIEFYMDSGDGLYDMKIVNETIDVCQFFRDKKYFRVMHFIYGSYVEGSNFPTSCPIKKKLYVKENMKIDVEKLPPTMPEKQMYLAATFISKNGSERKPLNFYKIFGKFVKI